MLIVLVLIGVPMIISGIFERLGISRAMAQVFILFAMVLIFTSAFRLVKSYEENTLRLIKDAKNTGDLKNLREKRITYRSKAEISKAIILEEFSKKEADRLKKYTNKVKDLDHYYSSLIANSDGKIREEIKIRRDNFKKKYSHKKFAYIDFKENLKTAIKWLVSFFILAFISKILGDYIIRSENLPALTLYYLFQMLILAAFMVNTIIWISRSLRSYWDKNYI